jgi:hypothetical protein
MSQGKPDRASPRTAADVAKPLSLSDEARAALTPGQSPRQYLDALLLLAKHQDAIRFLAAALPKRESVWWACLCLREALSSPLLAPAKNALEAAERWVIDPREPQRRTAHDAAEAAGWGTATGCAAAAAFWSSGSLAPANLPAVPPRDDLTAQGVAGALLLAAVADPLNAGKRQELFLKIGLEIAAGGRRWDKPAGK